jgi:hypothetical protein
MMHLGSRLDVCEGRSRRAIAQRAQHQIEIRRPTRLADQPGESLHPIEGVGGEGPCELGVIHRRWFGVALLHRVDGALELRHCDKVSGADELPGSCARAQAIAGPSC